MKTMLRRGRAAASPSEAGSTALHPSRDVVCATVDGGSVLLDLRRQQYVGLDGVGSSIWSALERGVRAADLAAELAREYDAPLDVLTRDCDAFVADLQRRGLLKRSVASVPRAPRLPSCLALLALVDASVRLLGLRRTLALVRRLAGGRPARRDAALLAETTRRLILAAAFYPRRALCLEQSLTLCVLLRRRGIPAELRLGVQRLPFYAHAWVEVDGQPIDERQDLPLQLSTFASLGV